MIQRWRSYFEKKSNNFLAIHEYQNASQRLPFFRLTDSYAPYSTPTASPPTFIPFHFLCSYCRSDRFAHAKFLISSNKDWCYFSFWFLKMIFYIRVDVVSTPVMQALEWLIDDDPVLLDVNGHHTKTSIRWFRLSFAVLFFWYGRRRWLGSYFEGAR